MKFHLQSNRNENRHSFSAKKRKRKSPDNISVFFLIHTFSHQVSPTMRRQYLVLFHLFLQVVLVDGIQLSSCRRTVYIDIFVAFFYMTLQPVNSLLSWFIATE